MHRTAVISLSALLMAGGLAGSGAAVAADDEGSDPVTRWIAVEDSFAIVLPDGTTFTGDEEPPPEAEGSAPVGSRVFISEVLHEARTGDEPGDETGRSHVECTAQVRPDNFLCDIVFVLDEGSQLHGTVHADFSAMPEDETFQLDIAVTGGTGEYAGATGVVSLLDITSPDEPDAATMTLYEADVVLP